MFLKIQRRRQNGRGGGQTERVIPDPRAIQIRPTEGQFFIRLAASAQLKHESLDAAAKSHLSKNSKAGGNRFRREKCLVFRNYKTKN